MPRRAPPSPRTRTPNASISRLLQDASASPRKRAPRSTSSWKLPDTRGALMTGSEVSFEASDPITAILREQLRGHSSILSAAVLGSGVLGTIMVAAQRGREPTAAIALWVALLAFGLIVRLGVGLWYKRQRAAIRS